MYFKVLQGGAPISSKRLGIYNLWRYLMFSRGDFEATKINISKSNYGLYVLHFTTIPTPTPPHPNSHHAELTPH